MQWKGRRRSSNVEDARGRRVTSGGSRAGAGTLINLVLRLFGVKGVVALAAVGFVGWQLGVVDPVALLGGGSSVTQVDYTESPEEAELYEFVEVVLADTEDVWSKEFDRIGREYRAPKLEVFSGKTRTACGEGDARMGPFYCPADQKVYIDLGFYDDLAQQFDAPGDFAQAYVIGHEVGHHIQNILGISEKVAARRGQADYNQYSVRLELQADYLAGVWANKNSQYLDQGDIQEAMRAANQIGDDAIQSRSQGKVVPHAFTHGSSEQRKRWFDLGLRVGTLEGGDTFKPAYEDL
ncbi:MAG: neutral zinc metallopeptidase [Congregibacter sp.]